MDLVERVAKAIARDLGVQEDGVPYNLDDDLCANYVNQNHADFGRLARAAIAEVLDAAMEPSEAALYYTEGMSDFVLPDEFDNSKKGRMQELRTAHQTLLTKLKEENNLAT